MRKKSHFHIGKALVALEATWVWILLFVSVIFLLTGTILEIEYGSQQSIPAKNAPWYSNPKTP